VGGAFAFDPADFRPVANRDGRFVPLLVETNRERVARNGAVYPARHLDWGRLERGTEPGRSSAWPGAEPAPEYTPHADWAMDERHRTIEVAIPWGLLNVGDPSSLAVIDDDPSTRQVETSRTEGIGLLAWATRVAAFRADSLGPSSPGFHGRVARADAQFLGPPGTTQSYDGKGVRVTTPPGSSYLWNGWEMPITHERIKKSARWVRDAFEGMEAREQRNRTDSNAGG
jgi:hypothetical protein